MKYEESINLRKICEMFINNQDLRNKQMMREYHTLHQTATKVKLKILLPYNSENSTSRYILEQNLEF